MSQEDKKQRVAEAALDYIPPGAIVGVGSGSTVNRFIRALGRIKTRIAGAVPSSAASAGRLRAEGIPLVDLADCAELPVYVDGADQATAWRHLIKGGGGALTREKIVAAVSARFVCIIDDSKLAARLGAFPLPLEVISMARRHVAEQMQKLGGQAVLRQGFTTDNGHGILDIQQLDIRDPATLEQEINQIAGVVANGLFARRPADVLLVADGAGVREI